MSHLTAERLSYCDVSLDGNAREHCERCYLHAVLQNKHCSATVGIWREDVEKRMLELGLTEHEMWEKMIE